MGNSGSQVGGERRKSGNPHHHGGSSSSQQGADISQGGFILGDIRPFAGGGGDSIGQPVDITTSGGSSPPSRSRGNKSQLRKEEERNETSAHRPRAGTESGTRRHANLRATRYARRLPTIFKYSGTAKDVYVSGSFNGWKKLPMVRSVKDFVAIVELHEGNHEYKFNVDGEWVNDTNAPFVLDEGGNKNNLIHVQKEDFDAYDALDMDSEAVSKVRKGKKGQEYSQTFGQEIPRPNFNESQVGPPILPPHLLQVILNKDTPLSCEPTLLPEPHHVMINHLYALSIKDGVMVLSSTQRYRKKYVTTLLYKPMGTRKED